MMLVQGGRESLLPQSYHYYLSNPDPLVEAQRIEARHKKPESNKALYPRKRYKWKMN